MAEGEGERTKKRLMVAIDESECSHYALEWALDNLRDSLSSPLLIFTVQPLQNVGFLAAASYGAPRTFSSPFLPFLSFFLSFIHFPFPSLKRIF